MKGIQDEATVSGNTFTGYQTLHYVDFPILAKIKFDQLFLEAGPQLGVLLSAKETVESGPASNSVSNKSQFKDTDFGYAFGLGFQAPHSLMVGLRYNGGFTNISKATNYGNQTLQPQGRNSAFQFYVGYLFSSK